MMPLYPYATHDQAPTTLGLLAGHPLMTIAAVIVILSVTAMLSTAAASVLRHARPLVRGTGQIVGITPEADGWAVVDLWFRGDLMKVRTRDHERETYSVGEPIVVHHTRPTLGHVEVRRLQRLGLTPKPSVEAANLRLPVRVGAIAADDFLLGLADDRVLPRCPAAPGRGETVSLDNIDWRGFRSRLGPPQEYLGV